MRGGAAGHRLVIASGHDDVVTVEHAVRPGLGGIRLPDLALRHTTSAPVDVAGALERFIA